MLNRLEFDVLFTEPGDGKSPGLSGVQDFPEGTMTITGSNEAGKSFRIEMIRFCLFGNAALRATKSSYRKLDASLDFQLKGKIYRVERHLSTSKLFENGVEIAASHSVVDAAIIRLFGYGLLVFDTAHCIMQGDVEKLGAMRPGERKRMVDQTIGLDAIDDLIKFAGDEGNKYGREAEAMRAGLVVPLEPEKPQGYAKAELIQETLKGFRAIKDRRTKAQTIIDQYIDLVEPEKPGAPYVSPDTVNELIAHQQEREKALRHNARLDGQLAMLQPLVKTEAEMASLTKQMSAWEGRQMHEAWVKDNPQPRYFEPTLDVFTDDWATLGKRITLRAQIDGLVARGEHVCPKCTHAWAVAQEEIDELEEELKKWPDVPKPPLQPAQIQVHRQSVAQWRKGSGFEAFSEASQPGFTKEEFSLWQRGIRDELIRQTLSPFQIVLADRSEELEKARASQNMWAVYSTQLTAYQKALDILAAAEIEMRACNVDPSAAIAVQEELLTQVQVYDRLLLGYNTMKERYDEVVAVIEDMAKKAENWLGARDALRQMKVKVKQHLVPSLSAVASKLLSDMTDGVRSKIEVSEDFDIVVDGQQLHTLSGSGKAVANLAVRVGLGQVLTSRVFPVLMGDEIDASMDDKRAVDTTDAFWSLRSQLKQIILVTHKDLQADHNIKV